MHMIQGAVVALAATAQALHKFYQPRAHKELAERASSSGIKLVTFSDNAMCLGLKNNEARDNQTVVLQPCADPQTPLWQLRGGALQTGTNMCLDVPNGRRVNGQQLQVSTCYPGNVNQQWIPQGNHLEWRNRGKSVDVTDGIFRAGTPLQLWDTFAENTNQAFETTGLDALLFTSSAASPKNTSASSSLLAESTQARTTKATAGRAVTDAGTFSGYSFISFDAFMKLHPVLNPIRQDIIDAIASVDIGLPPVSLAAQTLQESSGNLAVGNGGLCQCKRESWIVYRQGDINNGRDNLFAMARSPNHLLGISQNDLDEALRIYSGSLSFD